MHTRGRGAGTHFVCQERSSDALLAQLLSFPDGPPAHLDHTNLGEAAAVVLGRDSKPESSMDPSMTQDVRGLPLWLLGAPPAAAPAPANIYAALACCAAALGLRASARGCKRDQPLCVSC